MRQCLCNLELGWLSVGSFLCGNVIAESIYSFACKEKVHVVNHQNLLSKAHIKVFSASIAIAFTTFGALNTLPLLYPSL